MCTFVYLSFLADRLFDSSVLLLIGIVCSHCYAIYYDMTILELFIHSTVDGYLGCSQFLTTTDNAALSFMQITLMSNPCLSVGYAPRRGLAGAQVCVDSASVLVTRQVPIVLCLSHPWQSRESQLLHSLAKLDFALCSIPLQF